MSRLTLCAALSVTAGVRGRARTQRTYQKLRDSGTLAGGAAATAGLVSLVGAGQAMMAPQYAPPPDDVSAAATQKRQRRWTGKGAQQSAGGPSSALASLSAGMPRGAEMYTNVHDGEPDARIEPPPPSDMLPRLR